MFGLIILLIITNYLIKYTSYDEQIKSKAVMLNYLRNYILPACLASGFFFRHGSLRIIPTLLLIAAFVYISKILLENSKIRVTNTIFWAISPIISVFILHDTIKFFNADLIEEYDNYYDLVSISCFIWMVSFLVSANSQHKNYLKEAKQREIEEVENKKIADRKNELEIIVASRTAEIMSQKQELENTLEELKSTQNQLIQQEKLASLGELTAGIAHEIQNPLNFVNNFSEVSTELIDELREEREKPDNERDEALEEEILEDIFQNLKKINHHGKRASSIVKGMLEHSRASTGEKQLTDINALADEYLRLSYHGLRAKDKSFNADFKIDFDENLPKILLIPQDVGRVLLNLFNNAFYAVYKKVQSGKATEGYRPLVVVSTKLIEDEVVIKVKDNGLGISEEHISKIFQPFFTTKPTGEGTGLGLSISYDIITKGHGGTMKVESTEGEGTEFTIELSKS